MLFTLVKLFFSQDGQWHNHFNGFETTFFVNITARSGPSRRRLIEMAHSAFYNISNGSCLEFYLMLLGNME